MTETGREALQKALDYDFHNAMLLEQALTHASWVNENRASGRTDNERLEWLGDAVLQLVVSNLLFNQFEEATEEELHDQRKSLVDRPSLAEVGARLGLDRDDVLFLGSGERHHDAGREKRLADACEALVGAVYVDSGSFERTFEVVRKMFEKRLVGAER